MQKLKNEELAQIRGKLLSEIKGLQDEYKKNMEGIEGYRNRLKNCKKSWRNEKRAEWFSKDGNYRRRPRFIIGAVGLAIGTGGLGLVIVGVATAVGAIAAEHYAESGFAETLD